MATLPLEATGFDLSNGESNVPIHREKCFAPAEQVPHKLELILLGMGGVHVLMQHLQSKHTVSKQWPHRLTLSPLLALVLGTRYF